MTLAWTRLKALTSSTPRTRATSAGNAAGTGEKPSLLRTIRSALTPFWIESASELEMPEANTVTKVTSATPIISAAAVTAVRPGLRVAFSRASRPGMPRRRSIGLPIEPPPAA